MTEVELTAIEALPKCYFLPGCRDKKFVQNLAALPRDKNLTQKQREWLGKLVYKYRKQILNWKELYNNLVSSVNRTDKTESDR